MAESDNFEPTQEDGEPPIAGVDAKPSSESLRLRDRLRTQLTWLGIAWIVLGGIRVWVAFDSADNDPYKPLLIREVAPAARSPPASQFDWQLAGGVAHIIAGILVCGRVVWALYAAIALTCIDLLQAFARQDTLAVIFWLTLLFFSYWAIRRVQQLKRAGISIGNSSRVITIPRK